MEMATWIFLGAAYEADDITLWLNTPVADLKLSKSVNPVLAGPGDTIIYTLVFSNAGPDIARDVVITDIVAAQLENISYQVSGDNGVVITRTPDITYAWTVSDLALGQGGIISISAQVNDSLYGGIIFTNTATITHTSIESDTSDNTAQASVTVLFIVRNTNPIQNKLNVDRTTAITTTFSEEIETSNINTQTLTIRGLQSGNRAGTYNFPVTDTVRFQPDEQFHAGEVVVVNASSQISNTSGFALTPYAWQFTTEATQGDASGLAWTEQTITDTFNGAASVYAADVDGDGDLDILGAAFNADDITWWENTTGDGSSWSTHIVTTSFNGAMSVYAADVDGDGDLDVLGAAIGLQTTITWWENTNGDGFKLEYSYRDYLFEWGHECVCSR